MADIAEVRAAEVPGAVKTGKTAGVAVGGASLVAVAAEVDETIAADVVMNVSTSEQLE